MKEAVLIGLIMKYNDILKNNLPDILVQIRKDVENDENVREYVKSKDELDKLLSSQEKLLKDYLYDFNNQGKIDENYCWNFYKDLKIPYSVVFKSLQTLKISLMQHIMDDLDDKSQIIEVEKYINYLLNSIAKVYIKKDINTLKNINKSVFKKYLLFRAHLEWINEVIESLKNDNLDIFPLVSAKECTFHKYLNYPESEMVCMDAALCTSLHDVHHLIHKSANTFYMFYKKRDYVQAYIIYRELLESIMNFNKVITELYFLTYSNAEESLFKYVEFLLYRSDIPVYLTMIDIEKLKSLNANFGELTINEVLKKIDGKLRSIVLSKEEKFVLVKGLTADYYLLSVGAKEDEVKSIVSEIHNIVNDSYKVDYKEIEIKTIVVTLSLDGFYGKNRDDLTKLVFHLKSDAKKEKKHFFVSSASEKRELNLWLESSYKDINFISKMLEKESVDVVFQPIYNIENGEVEVLEALARIKDKDGKLISAGAFIDTIYAIGKVEELDRLVLKKILEYKKEIKMVAKTLFVNVSYKSLTDSRYKDEFGAFIEKFGNENIIFELTEQSIVENIDDILRLHAQHSVHFAVDDFGSGYSSLKTVSDLAREGVLRILKVDESLVKNLNSDEFNRKIVNIIANLANSLGLQTVGEFIENKEVYEKLKAYGITYAQGYYLSRPKLIDELLVEQMNGFLKYSPTD